MHENRIFPPHLTQRGFLGRGFGGVGSIEDMRDSKTWPPGLLARPLKGVCLHCGKKVHGTGCAPYFSSRPFCLPVFRLSKCILVQAGHMIPSYSFSEISGSSSNWCWTLRSVTGHLKTKGAIGQDMTAPRRDAVILRNMSASRPCGASVEPQANSLPNRNKRGRQLRRPCP